MPGFFQLFERPGNIDDVGNRDVIDGAGRSLGGGAVEGRRTAGLPDDPRPAGGIDAPQDRADVLRILDLVEDDDSGGPFSPLARSASVASVRRSTSATTPWCTPRFES